jgi:ribosomal protein S14
MLFQIFTVVFFVTFTMVKSRSYRIVKFSKYATKNAFHQILFRAILANKDVDSEIRALTYAYSRVFFNSPISSFKSTCLFTGRCRGVLSKFSMSRITFKKYAILGSVSGIRKSRW